MFRFFGALAITFGIASLGSAQTEAPKSLPDTATVAAAVQPAQPPPSGVTRQELYKKITDASGISLKDVFEAIFKKDEGKRKKLNEFAEREGGGRLQKGYASELEAAKDLCTEEKKTAEQCALAIEPLKREIAYLAELEKKFASRPTVTDDQNLAWAMIIFNFVVRHRILEPDMDGWSDSCARGPSALGGPCQALRFGLTHVNDLLAELTQASFEAKATGKINKDNEKRIAAKLSVYEKI